MTAEALPSPTPEEQHAATLDLLAKETERADKAAAEAKRLRKALDQQRRNHAPPTLTLNVGAASVPHWDDDRTQTLTPSRPTPEGPVRLAMWMETAAGGRTQRALWVDAADLPRLAAWLLLEHRYDLYKQRHAGEGDE